MKLTMLSSQTMELRGEDFDFSTEATDRIDPLYQGEEITMLLMPMLVNEE